MADQKLMKKRLKVLMLKPENQVCSDCPERQPRWASLIAPPPGAPPGKIGAFCCLECSGSHRRLGVHIAFVRSINLDSWKEQEVEFMENGGNAKVNAIFEARLAQSGAQKPTTHADGHTRERFIRDKYERRKYYDEAAYHTMAVEQQQQQSVQHNQDISVPAMNPGPPSDAARQRMEERRGRMKKSGSNVSTESGDSTTGRSKTRAGVKKSGARKPVAKAPASAPPPSMDLLDMSEPEQPTHALASAHAQSFQDTKAEMFDFLNSNTSTNHIDSMGSMDSLNHAGGGGGGVIDSSDHNSRMRAANAAKSASLDILSLYNTGSGPQQQQQGFNTNSNNPLSNHMSSLMQQVSINHQSGNNGMMQQQQQQPNMNLNYQQQQQQQGMNQQQQMYQQQMMMQQQQQQRQMMMNHQQQQQQGNQGGMMNNNNNMNNNNMMNMQEMQAQQNNGGGYGAPMGSGPPVSSMQTNKRKEPKQPEKQDPFADFGGMNAFR